MENNEDDVETPRTLEEEVEFVNNLYDEAVQFIADEILD